MSTGTAAIIAASPVTATGGVLSAPLGTAKPTDATSGLNVLFAALGYVDEAGVKRATNSSEEKIKAWGGATVKIVRTEHSVTYTFSFLESANATVLKAIYGEENVTITPPTTIRGGLIEIKEKGEMLPPAAYVLDMKDGKTRIREYIPNGQLTASGEASFVHSAVIKYDVTIEAMPGADEVKYVEWQDDGKKST